MGNGKTHCPLEVVSKLQSWNNLTLPYGVGIDTISPVLFHNAPIVPPL